ncbi:prepilin-type N-terminal cleavage/methylation domain-containing protein [Vibrio owensii]|uniref:prepilin-type N-terminal cleavage/methylation domain-containing protein n=1 Tax=Vibrio owensii TaxID=696485 RepID=UPI000695FD60|nr:prepilin-type N-terminal cleavage/methylation domain-containing protein [Vibrio owensii]
MIRVKGFTLLEVVLVIVLLGIIAITVFPKFMNLQRDARVNVIKNLHGSFVEAHHRLYLKGQIGDNLIPVENSTQYWLDVNGNGVADQDSIYDQTTMYGKDGEDIIMIDESKIDNHQLLKLVNVSDKLKAQIPSGSRHQAVIGFDMRGDGDIYKGNCRLYYNNDSGNFFYKTDGC